MDFLNAQYSAALVRVKQEQSSDGTLLDQVSPFLKLSPLIILDLDGIHLTSMRLGELLNVAEAYQAQWPGRFPGLNLVHVSDFNRKVLETAHLQAVMPAYATADAALQALSRLA